MGRRKERRLAAKIAAGRRVKLDISADSPGNLGGSSAHEAGEDKDSKVDTGSPKSPSSSGEQPANPLSLLGQYSDDDLDEDSTDRPNHVDNSLVDYDEEAKEAIDEENEELKTSHDAPFSRKVDELSPSGNSAEAGALLGAEDDIAGRGYVASADAVDQDINLVTQNSVALDTEAIKDERCDWKMVLHEENNSYYYWNTVTGETSWEVPDALAGKAQILIGEQDSLHGQGKGNTQWSKSKFTTQANSVTVGHDIGCVNQVSEIPMQNATEVDLSTRECKGDGHLIGGSTGEGYIQQETSILGNYSLCQQPGFTVAGNWSSMGAASAAYVNETMTNVHDEAIFDLPSRLVDIGEALLQKLKALGMSEDNSNHSIQDACRLKCLVEIETRLSDLKLLLPYGISLLPFWMHSERELRRLGNTISSDLVSYVEYSQTNEQIHVNSSEREGAIQDHGGGKLEVDAGPNKATVSSNVSPDAGVSALVLKDSDEGSTNIEQIQGGDYLTQSGQRENNEAKTSAHVEANIKYVCQSGEDVDMDVDMEVEDTRLSSNIDTSTVVPGIATSEQILPNQNGPIQPLAPSEELIAAPPPPLEEEWIPPPPPDDEEIPPPPPDEPPETLHAFVPSSYPDSMQSLSYTQSYSFTYPVSHYSYYGDATIGSRGSSFYNAEGTQNPVLNPTIYYEALPNSHPEAPVIVADPVGSSVYYGIQDGGLSTESLVSSSFQAAAGPLTYNVPSSNPARTVEPQAEVSALPLAVNGDNAPLGSGTELKASESFSHSFVAAVPANISTKENAPAASASTSTHTVLSSSATSTKPQSKVPRIKKRTVAAAPSLRSNKRVSSLVDKWKAAKEELEEEEEEEPDDPLEILEKKRRREIEEWRAQQIASGEAKDNANFQPVVGDWRERVKRRRAQKGATTTSPDVAAEENKLPNLTELSRDLPPGWQAYWDETTKQAYYGNALTSETTWTKPAR